MEENLYNPNAQTEKAAQEFAEFTVPYSMEWPADRQMTGPRSAQRGFANYSFCQGIAWALNNLEAAKGTQDKSQ